MIRGLYTGASGMIAQIHKMDAVSNNLANVDVTGYKKDLAAFKAFPELMINRFNDDALNVLPIGSYDQGKLVGKLGTGVELNEIYTVFEQGSLKETGNPFDLSIQGEGFFTIQTDRGVRYTRNGTFMLNSEGTLVTKDGYAVLGENGPIQIKKNNFVIDSQGKIYHNPNFGDDPTRLVSMRENDWDSMELVDTLQVVNFDRPRYLQKEGNSFWVSTFESGEAEKAVLDSENKVLQGFLESSNVNPVKEMVNLITINRAYEANQKVIQTQDSLAGKLINEAARY